MSENKQLIDLIYDNSLGIYDALINKKIAVNKLYKYIIDDDKEKLKRINKTDSKTTKKMLSKCSKYEFLDDLLSYFDSRFTHLKDIRNIVNLDEFINYILPEKGTFLEKVKIHYASLIIDLILDENYDYDDIKLLSSYKEELIKYERKVNTKIIKKINEYYIKKITI